MVLNVTKFLNVTTIGPKCNKGFLYPENLYRGLITVDLYRGLISGGLYPGAYIRGLISGGLWPGFMSGGLFFAFDANYKQK